MTSVLTRINNWGPVRNLKTYLRLVSNDYKSVALETVEDCKDRPFRAAAYGSGLMFLVYAYRTCPNEQSFREQLISTYTDMGLVNATVRNPSTYQHVCHINELINERTLKIINFGFFALMFRKDYNDHCSLYAAQCEYLKPSYYQYVTQRIVDVGFLHEWRMLNMKLKDYDVNPVEWNESEN
ncbi:hypothetical protein HDE_06773 [Halotydeus destructor]|nr:hypothetical protein HDE_06773 [Halotydeus destructor]